MTPPPHEAARLPPDLPPPPPQQRVSPHVCLPALINQQSNRTNCFQSVKLGPAALIAPAAYCDAPVPGDTAAAAAACYCCAAGAPRSDPVQNWCAEPARPRSPRHFLTASPLWFVPPESLRRAAPSGGPFVCRFDYERTISSSRGTAGKQHQSAAGVCA